MSIFLLSSMYHVPQLSATKFGVCLKMQNNNKNFSFSSYLGNKIDLAILFCQVTCNWKSTSYSFPETYCFLYLFKMTNSKGMHLLLPVPLPYYTSVMMIYLEAKLLSCCHSKKQLN